ncbi:CHRD domain-containing protein [Parasphingorhabdus sp.]|uniref:CHRD domain-containing protein n=1 Tax=Parasphingorhabdus sp. TaxID=2709688 RepID=UPI003002D4DB
MINMQKTLLAGLGTAALAGCATVEEKVAERTGDVYRTTLLGSEEVGPGDADGYGRAEISISETFGQICWDINGVRGIGPITAAHIHRGVRGTNGPPVFTLRPANEGGYKGCADGSEWTQDRIEGDPSGFYVNVHTAEYPAGAIPGQLSR